MAANEMTFWGSPKSGDFPRHWKEMSLDFKLMFVFHWCMASVHDRPCFHRTPRACVHQCSGNCAHIYIHTKAPNIRLALARRKTKRCAHGGYHRCINLCFPLCSDASIFSFEFGCFALVPGRIWHRDLQCYATTSTGFPVQ